MGDILTVFFQLRYSIRRKGVFLNDTQQCFLRIGNQRVRANENESILMFIGNTEQKIVAERNILQPVDNIGMDIFPDIFEKFYVIIIGNQRFSQSVVRQRINQILLISDDMKRKSEIV